MEVNRDFTQEEALPGLRFKEGRLQQLHIKKHFEGGVFAFCNFEWKYVPSVGFDVSDYGDK